MKKYANNRNIRAGKEIANATVPIEINNKSPLRESRKTGWMFVTCATCGVDFEKTAYNAKKVKNHYCSRECSGIAKRRRIECYCKICGAKMLVTPSTFYKTTTCGTNCSNEMKRILVTVECRDSANQNWTKD